MAVTLVLVRHGRAQSMAEAPSDEARELTPAGRSALERAYPATFSLLDLPADGDVEMWASPALRAVQTSEVVAANVPVRETSQHAVLFFQDEDAFLEELAVRVADRDSGVVVCVGHVPFMEDVALRLCGATLPFRPGAAAAIELDSVDPAGGRAPGVLRWFVQGPDA